MSTVQPNSLFKSLCIVNTLADFGKGIWGGKE